MRISEVADLLELSKWTLRRWCRKGLVEFDRTPTGRWRFTREQVDRLARALEGDRPEGDVPTEQGDL